MKLLLGRVLECIFIFFLYPTNSVNSALTFDNINLSDFTNLHLHMGSSPDQVPLAVQTLVAFPTSSDLKEQL